MILEIKQYLQYMAEAMPYTDEYNQTISDNDTIKQTMVDADLII